MEDNLDDEMWDAPVTKMEIPAKLGGPRGEGPVTFFMLDIYRV